MQPPASTSAIQNRDWQLSVDALYWRAHVHRFEYATEPADIDTTSDFTEGSLVGPDFKWNTGFREKFAYAPVDGKWDLYFQWTQIFTKANGSLAGAAPSLTDDGEGFYPVWDLTTNPMTSDYATSANEKWKLQTNIIDAVWGYHFDFYRWLRLTTHVGIRGALLAQHCHIIYYGGVYTDSSEATVLKNDFWGVGPLFQLDPEFYFDKKHNWGIFISGAGAMLLGQINYRENSELYFSFAHPGSKGSPFKLRWVVDFMAGLKYRIPFAKSKYAFTFKGGWEFHDFFHQNILPSPTLNLLSGNRDVILDGWFFSTQFEF